jgi:hypothetical protein
MAAGTVTLAPLVIRLSGNFSADDTDVDNTSRHWLNGSDWNVTDLADTSNATYWNGDNVIFISLTSAVLGVLILATIVGECCVSFALNWTAVQEMCSTDI